MMNPPRMFVALPALDLRALAELAVGGAVYAYLTLVRPAVRRYREGTQAEKARHAQELEDATHLSRQSSEDLHMVVEAKQLRILGLEEKARELEAQLAAYEQENLRLKRAEFRFLGEAENLQRRVTALEISLREEREESTDELQRLTATVERLTTELGEERTRRNGP